MLERFRDEPKVGSIYGDNFLPRALRSERPYGFSKYVQMLGWTTLAPISEALRFRTEWR